MKKTLFRQNFECRRHFATHENSLRVSSRDGGAVCITATNEDGGVAVFFDAEDVPALIEAIKSSSNT